MIRLVALACGLLCGAGFVLSGLHDPALLQSVLMPGASWNLALGLGLLVAVVTAALVVALAGKDRAPLLGGQAEPVHGTKGWKPLVSALVFGFGWGLAGYFPLAALAAAGMFSPGAAIFLVSVLSGMILADVLTGSVARKTGGGFSRERSTQSQG